MKTSVVWFVTWACNYKCDYCWQVQGQKIGMYKPSKFIEPDKWIEAFNKLNIGSMAVSGGEPFLQPGLIDILNGVSADTIGLTSNLSHSLADFCRKVSASKVRYITASYHPTENRISKDHFLGRVLLLKEHGFQVTVNLVAWPELVWMIPSLHAEFASYGVEVHIEPYAPMATYKQEYTAKQLDFIKQYLSVGRSFASEDNVLCSGGQTHFSIQPDGSAWRCILEKQQGINPVGNIFEADFNRLNEPLVCHQASNCPGCDRDHVKTVPLGSVVKTS